MGIWSRIKMNLRGNVSYLDLPREALRRKKAASRQKIERQELESINKMPVRLAPNFASFASPGELSLHFQRGEDNIFLKISAEENAQRVALFKERVPEAYD